MSLWLLFEDINCLMKCLCRVFWFEDIGLCLVRVCLD